MKILLSFLALFSMMTFKANAQVELCREEINRKIDEKRFELSRLGVYTGIGGTAASFGAGIGGIAFILAAPGVVLTSKILILQRGIQHLNLLLNLQDDAIDGNNQLKPDTSRFLTQVTRRQKPWSKQNALDVVKELFETGLICSDDYRSGIIGPRNFKKIVKRRLRQGSANPT